MASERLERAARGELPKVPQLVAMVVLDVTHTYLRLYGEERSSPDMGVLRRQASHPTPIHFHADEVMLVPPSEHGPN